MIKTMNKEVYNDPLALEEARKKFNIALRACFFGIVITLISHWVFFETPWPEFDSKTLHGKKEILAIIFVLLATICVKIPRSISLKKLEFLFKWVIVPMSLLAISTTISALNTEGLGCALIVIVPLMLTIGTFSTKITVFHSLLAISVIFFHSLKNYDLMWEVLHDTTWASIAIFSIVVFTNIKIKNVAEQANLDKLTGALNRHGYEKIIKKIENTDTGPNGVGMLFVDVDHFKKVNDTLGHDKGDEALSLISENIKKEIRKTDHLIRYGGDEFIVIFEDITESKMLERATEILNSVKTIDNFDAKLSVTLGLSHSLEKKLSYESLNKRADLSLYAGKEKGRSCLGPLLKNSKH